MVFILFTVELTVRHFDFPEEIGYPGKLSPTGAKNTSKPICYRGRNVTGVII